MSQDNATNDSLPPVPKDLQDPTWDPAPNNELIDALATKYGYRSVEDYLKEFEQALDNWTNPPNDPADGTGNGHEYRDQFIAALNKAMSEHWMSYDNQDAAMILFDNPKWAELMAALSPRAWEIILYINQLPKTYDGGRAILPYQRYVSSNAAPGSDPNVEKRWEEYMKLFTKEGREPWKPAWGFLNTAKRVNAYIDEKLTRPDTRPEQTYPWELTLGAAKFMVPPININVSQSYKVGSLTAGAIRQPNTPKFNSGYSETVVDMTLYFPSFESIWGVKDKFATFIDFDGEGDTDATIDYFLSSLRGLITSFKYAPFLPVRNEYLNRAWGITGVALQNMSISTLEDYPFCIVVNLTMLKFNHKVYLPVISDFNDAIHWGRYRQYMGRAATKINEISSKGFLIEEDNAPKEAPPYNPEDPLANNQNEQVQDRTSIIRYERDESAGFNFNLMWDEGRNLALYYPTRSPARIFTPDLSEFRQPEEDIGFGPAKDSWELFLGSLGIDVNIDDNVDLEYAKMVEYSDNIGAYTSEALKLLEFLHFTRTAGQNIEEFSGPVANAAKVDTLTEFIEKRVREEQAAAAARGQAFTPQQEADLRYNTRMAWANFLFTGYRETPFFKTYLQNAKWRDGHFLINEWDIPMEKMVLDWTHIFIQGVSVSLGNNFARLQVQMQDEPVHQHIGGQDSRVEVSMIVIGEEELIKMRRVFEHIKGLARVEHAHGVLGFLGIKNLLAAICGIKYVLPLSFDVETIPGYPRVYNVRLSFVDFDVFQQKRENLSSEQQEEFIEQFGKRNPFLRIKQLWSAFSAYPEFPLTVTEEYYDNATKKLVDKVVGHLDPDFYFKAFQTIDDQVARMGDLEYGISAVTTNKEARDKIAQLENAMKHLPEEDQQPIRDEIAYWKGRMTTDEPNDEGQLFPDFSIGTTFGYYNTQVYKEYAKQHSVTHHLATYGDNQDKVAGLRIGPDASITMMKHEASGQDGSLTPMDVSDAMELREESAVWQDKSSMQGTVNGQPLTVPFNEHHSPTIDTSANVTGQYQAMMLDTQYRDLSGRMIRAFPTYMLWLIDEGGRFAGVKLFDNFYGLQSVIDFSVLSSEDILGDTLVLRVSNLYQKLTSPYKGYLARGDQEEVTSTADDDRVGQLIDLLSDQWRNLKSGLDSTYVVELANIQLKPGVRVHLRGGYGSDPNALPTLFNGVITTVEQGDIMTITCQSDAIELAPYVNSTDKKGDSGHIDGALNTGFWLSEPRDLMVRLLSMGSSTFRETMAAATEGMIFSENRFGIRHFGQILYEPLNETEQLKQNVRYEVVQQSFNKFVQIDSGGDAANAVGNLFSDADLSNSESFQALGGATTTRIPIVAAMQAMQMNLMRRRDYELFMRNIYPGNGLGVAQYLGGDAADGGLQVALTAASKGKVNFFQYPDDATIKLAQDPVIGQEQKDQQAEAAKAPPPSQSQATADQKKAAADAYSNPQGSAPPGPPDPNNPANWPTVGETQLGQTRTGTADASADPQFSDGGVPYPDIAAPSNLIDLISSGAQLLGQFFNNTNGSPILQALGIQKPGMQDNDIPGFNEVCFRAQTYMKSVWDLFQLCAALQPNYIVAVRPFEDRSTIFYGKPHWLWTSHVIPVTTGVPGENGPAIESRDSALEDLQRQIMNIANPLSDFESQLGYLKQMTAANTSPYTSSAGVPFSGDIENLHTEMVRNGKTITIPPFQFGGAAAEELHMDAAGDPSQHDQLPDLAESHKYPAYRSKSGAFGPLLPSEEKWYMNMRWGQGTPGGGTTYHTTDYKGARVILYNTVTKIAVVATPGDWGPSDGSGDGGGTLNTHRDIGMSPDCWFITKGTTNDKYLVGFVPDDTPLGPIADFDATTADAKKSGVAGEAAGNESTQYVTLNQDMWDDMLASDEARAVLGGNYNPQGSITSPSAGGGYSDYKIVDLTKVALLRIDPARVPWFNGGQYANDPDGHGTSRLVNMAKANNPNLNLIEFAWAYGYLPGHNAIPVFLDPYLFGNGSQLNKDFDAVGQAARVFYSSTYAKRANKEVYATNDGGHPDYPVDMAQDIWNELRERCNNIFYLPWLAANNPQKKSEEDLQKDMKHYWEQFGSEGHLHQGDREGGNPEAEGGDFHAFGEGNGPDVQARRNQFFADVDLFMKTLWEDPYMRAFVVFTAKHIGDSWTDAAWDIASWAPDFDMLPGFLNPASVQDFVLTLGGNAPWTDNGDDWSWDLNSPLCTAFMFWQLPVDPDTPTKGGLGAAKDIVNIGDAGGTVANRVPESDTHKRLRAMMHDNLAKIGTQFGTVSEQITDAIEDLWDKTLGKWLKYITQALAGIVGLYRMSMAQLGEGLGMVAHMQKQANILNKVLNDSIYYSAGPVGSLLFLVDNPFTREYGEPVIEVREPFQRIHYISSFQHILSNGIQETTNNVPTVITATSDGQYPVTVYFDKGMPPEKQVESVVETGLYWDNSRGSGFFGFLQPLLHPIEVTRSYIKQATGSSDELLSKRVALYHLKEGLKDIYQGEVIVLGNPDIRAHDLVYMADIYERIYGMFEVEQVVHHFTAETGFITAITPNAIVTINDPSRWSMQSWLWSWLSVKSVRDYVRLSLTQNTNTPADVAGFAWNEIEENVSPQIKGHTQYTHGNSALARDLASYRGAGLLGQPLNAQTYQAYQDRYGNPAVSEGDTAAKVAEGLAGSVTELFIPGLYLMEDIFGDIWDWFRENLVDQHNCYIQFLTKDGLPMDGGLSYAQGMAVGTHYTTHILPGILGFPLPTRDDDGHSRITIDDLLSRLGWQELDITDLNKSLSWWVDQMNAKVLDLAGAGPKNEPGYLLGYGNAEAAIIEVSSDPNAYFDGDTFTDVNHNRYRLNGLDTGEVVTHNPGDPEGLNPPEFIATQAATYLRKRLVEDPMAQGFRPTVAIRKEGATYNRTVTTVFHNAPTDVHTQAERDKKLLDFASKTPLISWDTYLDDGRPYTMNWEMIMMGFSSVSMYEVSRTDPNGATGYGR